MIRVALAALLLGGCTVIEHVQVLPTVNPNTYDVSCCIVYWELSKSTSGSLEMQKSPTTWSVSAKVRTKF